MGVSRQRVHQLASGYGKLLDNGNPRHWYVRTRLLVFKRDGVQCQACGVSEPLIIHHIDGNDKNNELGNLTTLCRSCHRRTHAEAVRAKAWYQGICEECGAPFERKMAVVRHMAKLGRKPRYCSNQCRGKAWHTWRSDRRLRMKLICQCCGKEFEYIGRTWGKKPRYCSEACKLEADCAL